MSLVLHMKWFLGVLLAALASMVLLSPRLPAQETERAGAAESDLDAQLLEDLGGDFLQGEAEPPASADEHQEEEMSHLDQEVLESLGEDIGQSSPADDPNAFEQIGTRMRSAQRLLAERDTSGRATRMQDQIVADIDALIEQVQRRKRRSQQSGKPSAGSQRSDAQPQGSQPGQSAAEGQEPAADSTDELRDGSGEGASTDRRALQNELLENLWGHLPERAREQMLQSSDDEFLPKYELEIEQYFRRLAEDPDLGE